jgi:hypothetical protein
MDIYDYRLVYSITALSIKQSFRLSPRGIHAERGASPSHPKSLSNQIIGGSTNDEVGEGRVRYKRSFFYPVVVFLKLITIILASYLT